jgi:integrase
VRELPIVDSDFWLDLERLIMDTEAQPSHYLLPRRKSIPHKRDGKTVMDMTLYPDEPMGVHGLHNWWYRCLERAGVVPQGVTRGERMHKARHTAGQRLLDGTKGNLKAVQKLLGHKSMQTTGDVYTDWDLYQLADVLSALEAEE